MQRNKMPPPFVPTRHAALAPYAAQGGMLG